MINKVDGNNYNVYTKPKKIDIPDTDEKFSLGNQKNESSSSAKDRSEVSEQEKQQALERSGVRLELSVGGQAAEADRRKHAEAETEKTQGASQQTSLLETIRTYIMAAITAVREFIYNIWNDQPQEKVSVAQLDESVLQDAQSSENISEETQFVESDSPDAESLEDISEETRLAEGDPQKSLSLENISGDAQLAEGIPQNAQSPESVLWNASLGTSQESEEIIDASDEISALALEEERRNREIRQSLRDGNMDHVISLLTDNGRKTVAKNSTLLTSYDKNGRVVEPNASDRERALHGDRNTWKL